MKGYKTIKNPTFDDALDAVSQCAREAYLLGNREAVIDDIGAAALLHPILNEIDEAAAIKHAKHRRLPLDSFSSRLLEDGSTSDHAEDVKEARKRRDKKAAYMIDKYTAIEWERLGYSRGRDYPFRRVVAMATRFIQAHVYLRDEIAMEAASADMAAEQSTTAPKRGEPTANLLSWASAFWLIRNPDVYKGLLQEWRDNLHSEEPLEPIEEGHPEIREDFFHMLHVYFQYHLANKEQAAKDDPSFYFEKTFSAVMAQNLPDEIFSPVIPADVYERYFPNE